MKTLAHDTKQETYSLAKIQGTPFPNVLLEALLDLPETQVRIVLLIVRSTLGWQSGSGGQRRACVCFSHAQLKRHIGRQSSVSISRAVEALVRRGLLETLTEDGKPLATAEERRRYHRPLRFRIARSYVEKASGQKCG